MKRYAWLGLAAVMFLSVSAFAQGGRSGEGRPSIDRDKEFEMQQRELDLKERKLHMAFEQQMRQLKLQKQKAGLRGKKAFRHPRFSRTRHWGFWGFKLFLAGCVIVNLLLAVWVFQDIRQRNSGSGIWIVVALLAGCFGVLLYVLVRLGDMRAGESHKQKT